MPVRGPDRGGASAGAAPVAGSAVVMRRLTFHMLGGATMTTSVSAHEAALVIGMWETVQRSDSVQMNESVVTVTGSPELHIALGACVAITVVVVGEAPVGAREVEA